MPRTDARERLQVLRELLDREEASTQEELREELERRDFDVNQSTISRDLRKLGAIKMTDADGVTTYRLPADPPPAGVVKGLADLIKSVDHNGAMIVISTDAGSAPLVARHIDTLRSESILGTIAGDDTIFVAPADVAHIAKTVKELKTSFRVLS